MLAQHNCLHWANVVDKRQVNVFLAVGTMLAQRCRPALYLTLVQRMRNVHLTSLYIGHFICSLKKKTRAGTLLYTARLILF